jgi:hypothetical protein
MVHEYNPSTQEVDKECSPIYGQPRLYIETWSQN